MRTFIKFFLSIVVVIATISTTNAQYKKATPLHTRVSKNVRPYVEKTKKTVYVISWGADIVMLHGVETGIFKNHGWDIELKLENSLKNQVQSVINGKTPFLRTEFGMANTAAEALKKAGIEVVCLVQLSWSEGGDGTAYKKGKNLDNCKTATMQLDGPHMYFGSWALGQRGRLNDVQILWTDNLLSGMDTNPTDQFVKDSRVDVAFSIYGELQMAISSEGGVSGATMGYSTAAANKMTADVYLVTKSYYDSHKPEMLEFTRAFLKSQESFLELKANKASKRSEYNALMKKGADLILELDDAELMSIMTDECRLTGYAENYTFFTGKTLDGKTNSRNLTKMSKEIYSFFKPLNLMSSPVTINKPDWDFSDLSKGLKNTKPSIAKKDKQKVSNYIETASQSDAWFEEGNVISQEIYFEAESAEFDPVPLYPAFDRILDMYQANSGAILVAEGYTNGFVAEYMYREGKINLAQYNEKLKAGINSSKRRANKIEKALIDYAKSKGIDIDEGGIESKGFGNAYQKHSYEKILQLLSTDKEAARKLFDENMRGVLRIKEVKAEVTFDELFGN